MGALSLIRTSQVGNQPQLSVKFFHVNALLAVTFRIYSSSLVELRITPGEKILELENPFIEAIRVEDTLAPLNHLPPNSPDIDYLLGETPGEIGLERCTRTPTRGRKAHAA
jgi:hypothetical protein